MNPRVLEECLHEHIPLSQVMQIRLKSDGIASRIVSRAIA